MVIYDGIFAKDNGILGKYVFFCKYCDILGYYLGIFANTVVFWENTLVVWVNAVVFLGNMVLFWTNTGIFRAKTVVFWANTVVF